MKRFHRRILSGLAALSLLFCAACVPMWIRSESTQDWLEIQIGHRLWGLNSGRGRLKLCYLSPIPLSTTGRFQGGSIHTTEHLLIAEDRPQNVWQSIGFFCGSFIDSGGAYVYELLFRCWVVMIATGLLPVLWFCGPSFRRNRSNSGHCSGCGYDLRATPDRCPECGNLVEEVV